MAEQKNEKTKQTINKTHIFKTNFFSTLGFGKTIFAGGADEGAVGVLIAHTLLLPLSLTLGVGIKTLIDINTRHALPQIKIDNSRTTIENLDDTAFDKFVHNLLEYHAHSHSSKALIKKLLDAQKTEESAIESTLKETQALIKRNKLTNCNARQRFS